MKNKVFAIIFAVMFCFAGMTAYAQSSEPTAATPTPTETEITKTLTPNGNANLLDDVAGSEDLQFITVTARDGNVFYIVIDRKNTSENVYFLNMVDESDLAALSAEYKPKTPTAETVTPTPTPEPVQEQQPKDKEQPQNGNNNMMLIILVIVVIGGVGFYYFKVYLPKKKLEQADDIEDFEFEEEETINEDEEETEDDKQ